MKLQDIKIGTQLRLHVGGVAALVADFGGFARHRSTAAKDRALPELLQRDDGLAGKGRA